MFGELAKLRKTTISLVMSIRLSAWNNSPPTERFFLWNFILWNIFQKSVEEVQVSLTSDKNDG